MHSRTFYSASVITATIYERCRHQKPTKIRTIKRNRFSTGFQLIGYFPLPIHVPVKKAKIDELKTDCELISLFGFGFLSVFGVDIFRICSV